MSLLYAVLKEADKVNNEDYEIRHQELISIIKDLEEKIQLLSWTLESNFIATYLKFTVSKSLEQINYSNRKANISNEYSAICDKINSYNDCNEIENSDLKNMRLKLKKSFDRLNSYCVLAEGRQILDKCHLEFDSFNYSKAMLDIINLQKKCENIKVKGDSAKAFANFTSFLQSQLATYYAQISMEWEDIFSWSERNTLQDITYSISVQQADPPSIKRVLKTLYITHRLNAELALFSHFFVKKLLRYVIRHNCNIYTEESVGAIIFNIKIEHSDCSEPNYQAIFNNLTAIFEFLQSTLGSYFEGEETFIGVFANTIRSSFFDIIIDDCIKSKLPSCESMYENYKNFVVELESFNKFLIDVKFVDVDESPLNKYINKTESVLYRKKCDKLLNDCRLILSESLSSGTKEVGEDIHDEKSYKNVKDLWDLKHPLFLPKCVVSKNVEKIMSMIVEHLEESEKMPEEYGNMLASHIKDIATMYQCMVPHNFEVNLRECPLDIALFFNNCFYFAHGLLGPPWRNCLSPHMSDLLATILLESIQGLRVGGLEKISLYLQYQKSSIVESIELNETPPWSYDTYEEFNCAINKAVNVINRLKSCWLRVLPRKMYEMALCTLAQTICESILNRMFADTKPVPEEIVCMLALKIDNLVDETKNIFEEPIEYEKRIDVWKRFVILSRLLRAQLVEISNLWSHDKNLVQAFTCEEIRHIIKIRFPDDNCRLSTLREIQ